MAQGKLVWSVRAWRQLLGLSVSELLAVGIGGLRELEEKMLCMRIHLCFGWWEDLCRIAVLGVKS